MLEAKVKEAEWRLDRRPDERRPKGQCELGMPGPEFPSGNCERARSCPIPHQAHQSLTVFVISGRLWPGVSVPMVKALGFKAAS